MHARQEMIGRLTKDPEIKMIGENKVANFTIACDDPFSKKDGTDFYNCVAWNKTAEVIENWGKKGRLVYAEGRPKNRSYEQTKDGVTFTQRTTDININNIRFLDKNEEAGAKKEASGSAAASGSGWGGGASWGRQPQAKPAVQSSQPAGVDLSDDDLPF